MIIGLIVWKMIKVFNFGVISLQESVCIHTMALLSQAGGAYTVSSGVVCSKTGTKAVSGCVRNLRMKEAYVSSYSRTLSTESMLKRSKRGHQLIVAASPPTEEAVVATEPLTREDLIAYLASGCKSKDKWRYSLITYVFVCVRLLPLVFVLKSCRLLSLLNSIPLTWGSEFSG